MIQAAIPLVCLFAQNAEYAARPWMQMLYNVQPKVHLFVAIRN